MDDNKIIPMPTRLNAVEISQYGCDGPNEVSCSFSISITEEDVNTFIGLFEKMMIPILMENNFEEKKSMTLFGALSFRFFKLFNLSDEQITSIMQSVKIADD